MATKILSNKARATNANGKAGEKEVLLPGRLQVNKTYKMFVGGAFPRTESGRFYELTLKDSQKVNLCLGSRKDFRNAVSVARKAQTSWAGKTAYLKSQIIYRIAEMLEGRATQFIDELQLLGFSHEDARSEVQGTIDTLVHYAGWCDKFQQVFSSVNPVQSNHFNFSVYEPTGVVAMAAPENAPLLGLVNSFIPAIASGNTAVVLASYGFATVAISFAEVLHSSDLPAGVVNILTGTRKELLSHFASHMDVNSLYLHGATNDELKELQQLAAGNVKRVVADLTVKWPDLSPYRILDFTEVKTTWHPVGVAIAGSSSY